MMNDDQTASVQGRCIDSLYIMAFTSGLDHAGSDGGHEVEIRTKNPECTYKSRLPNRPVDDYLANKGDLWKMNLKKYFHMYWCVIPDKIDYIAIGDSSNDGWNIESIVTFLYYDQYTYELATVDFNVYRWIDGDGHVSYKHFELTKVCGLLD